MRTVVLDASALVEYLLCSAEAKPVRSVLADLDVDVRIPALCDVEVVSALWSAFASNQAAEKAIKALFQRLHRDAWGHALSILLSNLPQEHRPDSDVIDRAKELDKHYIPTRYPNGFERGAPTDFYTAKEADQAISNAEAIIAFCRRQID